MRVTVNHSVELEDIPSYVVDIIDKIDFKEISCALGDISKRLNSETNLNAIMFYVNELFKIKKQLVDIDAITEDCASILSGYVKVKNEMLAEQAESLLSEAEDLSQADEGSPEKSD